MPGASGDRNPRRHLTPLRRWLYPELELTPDGVDPRVILIEAQGRAAWPTRKTGFCKAWRVIAFPLQLAAFFVVFFVLRAPFSLSTVLLIVAPFLATDLLISITSARNSHRDRVRRIVRELLRKRGVPVCLECGYDLQGLPEDETRCPECAAVIADVHALSERPVDRSAREHGTRIGSDPNQQSDDDDDTDTSRSG